MVGSEWYKNETGRRRLQEIMGDRLVCGYSCLCVDCGSSVDYRIGASSVERGVSGSLLEVDWACNAGYGAQCGLTSRLASSGVWVNQRQTDANSLPTIKFNVEFN